MTQRALSFLTAVAVILTASGCASTATNPNNDGGAANQREFVAKKLPSLTDSERQLLSSNGYAVGIWSQKCGDPSALQERYFEDGKRVMSEVRESGKVVRRSEFHDVTEVSKSVIKFKNQGVDFIVGQEFVSETKSGFTGGKKMVFDQSVVFLGGQSAGEQLVQIKDGYEVTNAGAATVKGRRAPMMVRCP